MGDGKPGDSHREGKGDRGKDEEVLCCGARDGRVLKDTEAAGVEREEGEDLPKRGESAGVSAWRGGLIGGFGELGGAGRGRGGRHIPDDDHEKRGEDLRQAECHVGHDGPKLGKGAGG